jgi:hypothetical protein
MFNWLGLLFETKLTFLIFVFAIVLSVLLRIRDSENLFGIFLLFFAVSSILNYKIPQFSTFYAYLCGLFDIYMYCRWISTYQKGRVWIPLTCLTPSYFCACLKAGPGFSASYVVVCFLLTELRWESIVRFFDIGGIVENHCLNCLFAIYSEIQETIRKSNKIEN